jgi:hypothetical protein
MMVMPEGGGPPLGRSIKPGGDGYGVGFEVCASLRASRAPIRRDSAGLGGKVIPANGRSESAARRPDSAWRAGWAGQDSNLRPWD